MGFKMSKMKYSYDIYTPAGDRIGGGSNFYGYLFAKENMKMDMCECVNNSVSFLYRVYANGKTGKERKFILKGDTVLEIGLLTPKIDPVWSLFGK
jgi:hypothetical protein